MGRRSLIVPVLLASSIAVAAVRPDVPGLYDRLQDDDDGDLTNGTPHGAAIFAPFDRHDIACGLPTDAENQNTSSCPALAAPVASFTACSGVRSQISTFHPE